MKKTLLAALLVALAGSIIVLTGCRAVPIATSEGEISTRQYDFTGFDRVEAGDAFDIEITRTDNYSIAITTGENVFERLNVSVSGSTLRISMKNLYFPFHKSPRAVITMPTLRGVHLSGASDTSISGFDSSDDFSAEVSGASSLDLEMQTGAFEADLSGASHLSGHLVASGTDLDLSGASHADLNGSGGNARMVGSGASHFDLKDFAVADADIDLSGASGADVTSSGQLDAALSGASSLRYGGEPTLGELDISGGSSIKRR